MLPPKLELMPFWMMLNLVTRSHYLCFSLWKMSMSWWVDLFLKQQILKPSALNPFFEARLLETIFCLVQAHKVVCTRPDFVQNDVFWVDDLKTWCQPWYSCLPLSFLDPFHIMVILSKWRFPSNGTSINSHFNRIFHDKPSKIHEVYWYFPWLSILNHQTDGLSWKILFWSTFFPFNESFWNSTKNRYFHLFMKFHLVFSIFPWLFQSKNHPFFGVPPWNGVPVPEVLSSQWVPQEK